MSTGVFRTLKGINAEVTKLDRNLKSLGNESKDLDKALKIDPTNLVLASAKADNLKKGIGLATQKIKELTKEQEKMGEDAKTDKATEQKFNKITVEIAKAETQIMSFNTELTKSKTLNLEKVENAINKVGKASEVVLKKIVEIGTAYAKSGDEVSKASAKYNIGAESFQKNAHIFDKTTGNAKGYTQALDNVQKQISAVAKGSTRAINAFSAIGVSAEELTGLGTAEALELIRGKLSLVADEDERVVLANALLTTSGFDVAQVAGLTSAEIDTLNGTLAESGILTQEQADKAGEISDKMSDFDNSLKMVTAELGFALLPLLSALIDFGKTLIPVISFVASIFTAIPKPMQVIIAVLLVLLIALPKLIAIVKAVNAVMIATKLIAATNPFVLIAAAVAILIMLLGILWNWLSKIFGKKHKLDTDTSSLGVDMATATGSASSKDLGGYTTNNTTVNNDYSTMNNTIDSDLDIDDIAEKLSTKKKIGGK